MKLKATQETNSGLNTRFVNTESNRTFSREHVISQINNGNSNYDNYHVVNKNDGTSYVRSNPDSKKTNNLE